MRAIIFLNGCGSSGKTSIARGIQHLSPHPWLRFGIDLFIEMMPDQYIAFGEKAKEGYFSFIQGENERGPTMHVEQGPLGDQVFNSMPTIAHILANKGNNLIIDEVLFGNELLLKYIDSLKSHTVYFIGIHCHLENMQEREILRRDRAIGLSNDQLDRVHCDIREYDLNVDTTQTSPYAVAKKILEFIKRTPNPQGFIKMREMQ